MIDPTARTPQQRAALEWASLAARLRSLTPRGVARAALVVAVGWAAITIAADSWPVLVPFAVGGLIAYTLLPVVDVLDRAMPRVLAATVAMVSVAAIGVAALVLVVPPLASGFVQLAVELPTSNEIQAAASSADDQLSGLPEGSREIVVPLIAAVASALQGILSGMSGGLDDAVRGVARAMLQAVSAFLGLIVLPAWMVAAMNDRRRIRRAVDARLAPWVRQDVWAVAALADRAAGAYLRGYVVAAAFVGLLAYLGAAVSPRLGGPEFPQPLALGVFAGVMQLVPVVGPLLGFLPGLLLLVIDPERAVAYVGIYVAAQLVGTRVVGARLMQRRLGVHPLLLVPSVLIVGQAGLLWLLLSAPIVTFVADVIRYFHGRWSEPPRPAGVLPRTAAWEGRAGAAERRRRLERQRSAAPAPLSVTPPAPAPPA